MPVRPPIEPVHQAPSILEIAINSPVLIVSSSVSATKTNWSAVLRITSGLKHLQRCNQTEPQLVPYQIHQLATLGQALQIPQNLWGTFQFAH